MTVEDPASRLKVPLRSRLLAFNGALFARLEEVFLRYDPTVLQPLPDLVDLTGTVSRGLSVVTNAKEPGILRVVVYGAMPIDKDGVLLNLRFTAVGAAGSASPLTFERIMFNKGGTQLTISDGQVVISAVVISE